MNMKNSLKMLAVALTCSFGVAQAQNTALSAVEYGNSLSLAEFHPVNNQTTIIAPISRVNGMELVPNSFYHDQVNNRAIFMERSASMGSFQNVRIVDSRNGEDIKTVSLNGAMLPVHIAKGNKIGFISTQRTFSGYNNNDDDNSFAVFDLITGKLRGKVSLNSISFSSIQAPFLGESMAINTKETKKVGLGSSVYIPELDEVAFCAMDVTGYYRLYRLDVEQVKLKSSIGLSYFVVSLDYDEKRNDFIALYVDQEAKMIRLGRLNPRTGQIENGVDIRAIHSAEQDIIKDGFVTIDRENDRAIVMVNQYVEMRGGSEQFVEDGIQEVHILNCDDLTAAVQVQKNANVKVDFHFPVDPSQTVVRTLENSISMYPNPGNGNFTVEAKDQSRVLSVSIMSLEGQMIRAYVLNTSELTNSFDASDLAPGVYLINMRTPGAIVTEKLIIQ
jgi:hypothetical protein